MRKRTFNRLITDEKGQALIMVLILLLLGGLILPPLLSHVGSGLKVGKEVYEERMHLFYAADSGIEDALWQIKYEQLSTLFTDYDLYGYSAYSSLYQWPYSLEDLHGENVNGKNVNVTIENAWIPKDIDAPSPSEAREIIEGTTGEPPKLVVFGSISGASESEYRIRIAYYWDDAEDRDNLMVQKIGIWLPPGFHYDDEGSCSLTDDPHTVDFSVPVVDDYCSGKAVVWDFGGSVSLKEFLEPEDPNYDSYPMVRTIAFQFLGPEQGPGAALSWIDTTGVTDIDYAWDADTKVYAITSTATDATEKETTIEAHIAKIEMRKLGSAISGDYCAVGGTLMTSNDNSGNHYKYRETLFKESSATIAEADIPANAYVEAAYLYWSGWIDFHYRYYDRGRWRWGTIDELKYPDVPTAENLRTLVEEAAKVNGVSFGSGDAMNEITTHEWQLKENDDRYFTLDTWSYACFYDATDQVKQLIEDGIIESNGSGTYALSHVPEDRTEFSYELYDNGSTGETTGYPLGTPAVSTASRYEYAYAGWSLIIIYSSPETKGHQLYIYGVQTGDFTFIGEDYALEIPVRGFLAPDPTAGSRLTCFVGEGDEHYGDQQQGPDDIDYIKVNGTKLWDGCPSYTEDNVWNSYSNAIDDPGINGIDIDTFDMSDCINPGDTFAEVIVGSGFEIYNLVYIILSFRSEITTGGILSYLAGG